MFVVVGVESRGAADGHRSVSRRWVLAGSFVGATPAQGALVFATKLGLRAARFQPVDLSFALVFWFLFRELRPRWVLPGPQQGPQRAPGFQQDVRWQVFQRMLGPFVLHAMLSLTGHFGAGIMYRYFIAHEIVYVLLPRVGRISLAARARLARSLGTDWAVCVVLCATGRPAQEQARH